MLARGMAKRDGNQGRGGNRTRTPGARRPDLRIVRLSYECARSWDSLTPTEDPSVRHCDLCHQAVYRCTDPGEAAAHAASARCVAIDASGSPYRGTVPAIRARDEGNEIVLGMPAYPSLHRRRSIGWIVPLEGPQQGQLFELGEGVTVIGSSKTADVRLKGERIAQDHCRIIQSIYGFELARSGSVEHTYIDGHPVFRRTLNDGDVFVVGKTRVVFKCV